MAESLAIRDGIVLVASLSLEKVLLETDNLEVVQACGKENQRGEIRTVLEDIWRIKEDLPRLGGKGMSWLTNYCSGKNEQVIISQLDLQHTKFSEGHFATGSNWNKE